MSIATSRNGQILEVTIDRPKANAIDALTSRELSSIFESFMLDNQLRVAILTGAGNKFSLLDGTSTQPAKVKHLNPTMELADLVVSAN